MTKGFRLDWERYTGFVYTALVGDGREATVFGYHPTDNMPGSWLWYVSKVGSIGENFMKGEQHFKRSDTARLACERVVLGPIRKVNYDKQKKILTGVVGTQFR
tara:strand:+ start:121 stop:429 length:309 start_codon:yes stop_codon:yes gene_type:complete